ncbi:GNAT family N-acetyltransferase [Frankia sp. CiP1_Cm_nod2]|uniref:GNAT family N-acetyltransferase n=1 Tax=Frankia sp. CiP1_Cm_nod2 TaxID=2897161 RepID=UPI002023E7AE
MTLHFGPPSPGRQIPTLVTERLILRDWRAEDITPYSRMTQEPEMSRYTGGGPMDEEAVWRHAAFQLGHWALRGFGMWVVRDRFTGEFIGRAGLYEELGWPGVEVAWTVRRDRWGQGLAPEAGTAAVEFAFLHVGVDRVVSICHPDNARSRRVMEKVGLALDGAWSLHGRPSVVYAITREAWAARSV